MFRILAVDDNIRYLNLIKTILENEEMEMHLAESAAEALLAIKEREFDLIITDLNMPGMDGIELAMMIRDIAPELPIIMLTGAMIPHMAELAKGAGIKTVLEKTISPKEMVRLVKEEANDRMMQRGPFLAEADKLGNPHIAVWVCPRCQSDVKAPLPQATCTSCGQEE